MSFDIQTKLPKFQTNMPRPARNAMVEIVLLLIVGVLFYWFIVSPKSAELAAKQSQNDEVQKQVQSVNTDIETLRNLSADLSQHDADISRLDQALPLSERQVRTEMLFDRLIQSSGIVVNNVNINTQSTAPVAGDKQLLADPYGQTRQLKPVNVAVSVSGTLDQLLDLITKFENYGRLIDIQSMSLGPGQDGQIAMQLNLVTYYFGAQ
ncbi:MAG: hypothetical protein KGJ93_02445 [Patescibacteria group bacterium]|nr:hypothetical protein [Patescibacteria group bacterium]